MGQDDTPEMSFVKGYREEPKSRLLQQAAWNLY
jgi:hypothetical protein